MEALREHSQLLGVITGYIIFVGAFYLSIQLAVFGLTIPPPDFSPLYNLGFTGSQIYVLRTMWIFLIWFIMLLPLFVTLTISIEWFTYFIPQKDAKPLPRYRRIFGGIAGFFLTYCFLLLAFALVDLHFLILVNITNLLPYPYSLPGDHVILFPIAFITLVLYFLTATTIQSAAPKQFLTNCFNNPFFWITLIILYALQVAVLFHFVYTLFDIEETLYIQFSLLPIISLPLAIMIPALPLNFIIFGNHATPELGKSNLKN